MTKEKREQLLKQIAKSPEGEALKDWLEERIDVLKDASTYPEDSFELTGKASVKAVAVLKTLMFELGLLKETKLQKENNQYK